MQEKTDIKVFIGNVCFVIDKGHDKILLLRRNKEPMEGMYTGVGGKTPFEEIEFNSCVREAREETGLNISGIKLRGATKTVSVCCKSS